MDKREVEQFEKTLQQAAQGRAVEGRLAPLLQAARQAMALAETPPPPPHGLAPGRRMFLAEAARLRAERASRKRLASVMRLAALAVFAIVFAVVLGVGSAVAGSLPGQPVYGLKLAAERVHLALTGDPARRAVLALNLAEERLDEIATLLDQDQAVDTAWLSRAERQLRQALQAAAQLEDAAAVQALQRLAEATQQRERWLQGAAGESPQAPLRELVRVLEQVRQEAQAGQGDPEGLRQRLRQGTPAEPSGQPGPTQALQPSQTPGGPSTATPQAPSPSGTPGPSHTPRRTGMPDQTPGSSATAQSTGGPHASRTPGPSATLQPTEPPYASRTPGPSGTPAPTGGPSRTPGPRQTPGSGGGGGKKP